MNNEPKILLTINLEGGTLRKGETTIKKWYLTKKDMFPYQSFKGNDGDKIIKSGKYKHTPLIPKECVLKTTLTRDAYDAFQSDSMPEWFHSQKEWRKKSPVERLELHLARISSSYNGKSFSYQIIED